MSSRVVLGKNAIFANKAINSSANASTLRIVSHILCHGRRCKNRNVISQKRASKANLIHQGHSSHHHHLLATSGIVVVSHESHSSHLLVSSGKPAKPILQSIGAMDLLIMIVTENLRRKQQHEVYVMGERRTPKDGGIKPQAVDKVGYG